MSVFLLPAAGDERGALATAAYDAFAPFYDALGQDADYAWWWSVLLPLAHAAGLPQNGVRVLDVACGTGNSTIPLLERGWDVVGVDCSAGMLAEARRKLGPDVVLEQHDMRTLPSLGAFDFVCALNDPVNYLLDERELAGAFRNFAANLAPGGVLLFDVNTLGTFRNYDTLVRQEPGRILLLEGQGGADFGPGDTMHATFVVLEQRKGSPGCRAAAPTSSATTPTTRSAPRSPPRASRSSAPTA